MRLIVAIEKPWRRDAWRWALKYGALATVLTFFYLRRQYHPPELSGGQLLRIQVGWALGLGAFATVAIFWARTSGMLLDLDELEAGGRGGLKLRKPERRTAAPDAQDQPESNSGSA
jgi:hypothetical protein